MFVVLFYVFALLPTLFARRFSQDSYSTSSSSAWQEVSIFITMGFVVSALALPIVLARTGAVS